MTDSEFLAAFEDCTLSPDQFHHRDHIRVVWMLLTERPLIEALARFTDAIKRYAASLGKPGLYHETITWAYILLVHERMQRRAHDDWQSFCDANPDLMTWNPSVLDMYYRQETLTSELARRAFVMPDRAAPAPPAA